MKCIQINTVCNESTGSIMHAMQKKAIEEGHVTLSIVGRRRTYSDVPCIKIGNALTF